MPDARNETKPELSKLEERVRSLALEKSYLQLVNNLMCSLGEVHGLSSIDEAILRLILDNLGGDNVSMHYFVGQRIHYCDVYGVRRFPEQVDDPLVKAALGQKCLVEQLGDFADTRMTTPAFTQASTWAEPMMVGDRLVGVLKCEGMLMSAGELREHLRPFLNYAALVLKNEIDGHLEMMESAHLAAIVHSSEDGIIGKTLDGIVTSWNRGAESIYGYTAEEVIGQPITLLTDQARSQELSDILRRLRQGLSIEHLETQRRRKDGRTIEVSLTISPIKNAQGQVVGASTIARDITRQKEDERRLKDSEQRIRLTLEAAQIGTWEWDVRADRWVGSPIYHSMLGNEPPSEPQNSREWLQSVHPGDLPLVHERIRDVLERNFSSCSFEVRMRHANGSYRWQHVVGFGVERDQESRVQRMLGVRMDVDVRKCAEEAQLRVNRELRAVSSCHQILLRAEDEQTLLENICRIICTEAGYRLAWVGYAEQDEARSIRPMAWAGHEDGYVAQLKVTWADTPRGQGPSGTAVRTGENTCCQDFRTDPKAALWREEALKRGYLSNISLPLKNEDNRTFGVLTIYSSEPAAFTPEEVRLLQQLAADLAFGIITLRAKSERKRADAALRESELRFRQISESIEEAFWLADPLRRRMIYVSPAFEKIWGRSCASLHSGPDAWLGTVHPEDRVRTAAAFDAHAAEGYDIEYRIVRPDGTPRWIRDRAFPIRNASGKVERIAGVAADVTEQKQLEAQFRHVQKMEAIGQFAGGIAHDFNNLLAAVQLQASLILTDAGLSQEAREGIQSILTVSESAAGLTRQILTFSRRNVPQKRELHLDEVIEGMIKLLRRVLGEDISLETRFAATLPIIHADPGMMEQILMNLAVNARDAMTESGRLSVTLDTTQVPANRAALHPQVQPGQFVVLSVSDTGCGIPPELLTRIFEPFFTTKPVGKGTGLGLATVFGIVQQHGGWLEVDSVVGKGTTFRIFLPALSAAAQEQSEAAKAKTIPGGKETVLLVEDNSVVRALARTTLEHYGYKVLEASSGRQALEVWERNSFSIDLLLTDLVMPGGMSGLELAEQLLSLQPRLRVLYTSGYSHDVVGKSISLDRETNFLHKPFSIVELATLVRRCLDAPRK